MRRILLLLSACFVMSLMLAPSAMAQNDPTSYDISEYNPNGPCFDTEASSQVSEVPIEELPNAFLNRNDSPGTPISSPLDPDNDGIACNSLTKEEAQEQGREAYEAYELSRSNDGARDDTAKDQGNQEFTPQRADICQGLFPASPPNSNVPGEGDLECFETAEQAKTFAETGEFPSDDTGQTAEIPQPGQPQCSSTEGCFLPGNGTPEEIVGGPGPDYISGDGGGDVLWGLGGGDWVDGNTGDDLALGNDGDDLVTGGKGDDAVYGDAGDDYVSGDAGKDSLEGGSGKDYIYAADGEFDSVSGGPGYDVCVVDKADDVSGCEETYTD